MQILVTGGAGFIGAHLVEWLVEQGHQVRIFDNFSTGKRNALDHLRAVDVIEGDIRDHAQLQLVLRDVECVFHLAAMVSVTQSVEQPLLAYAVNLSGSLNLFEAARQSGVRRVVQASTCAVYGNTERLPVSETDPLAPLSPYAATKLAAEQAGQLYTRLYGLETVALRFFNVYGPRQDPASPYAAVVPRFIAALREGRQPTIYGDGLQSRDFIFVGDIVQALWVAARADNVAGQVFNVGRGEAHSVLELALLLGELMETAVHPVFQPARSGEVLHSCAAVDRLAERSGFRAGTDLAAGLRATLAGFHPQS